MPFSNELILVVGLALLFEFLNGMRDASNIVATMIYSRAFHPRTALVVTAIAEFAGPFLFGVTVAKTVGDDIVASQVLSLQAAYSEAAYAFNLGSAEWGEAVAKYQETLDAAGRQKVKAEFQRQLDAWVAENPPA